jgi:hypothetical protein
MEQEERDLAAYAQICRMYGLLTTLQCNAFIWWSIKRTSQEITNTFSLRRLRNTPSAYSDTRELSAIFDFAKTIQSHRHAWNTMKIMLEEQYERSPRMKVATRLIKEIEAIGDL